MAIWWTSLTIHPKTVGLGYGAQATWMLGYPEQAVQISDATNAHARRLGHPFDRCWALTTSGMVFDYRSEPDEKLKRTEEAERVGRENSLPLFTEVVVPANFAIALIEKGQLAEGMASLKARLAAWEGGGARLFSPCLRSFLAEGMAQLGDLMGRCV